MSQQFLQADKTNVFNIPIDVEFNRNSLKEFKELDPNKFGVDNKSDTKLIQYQLIKDKQAFIDKYFSKYITMLSEILVEEYDQIITEQLQNEG